MIEKKRVLNIWKNFHFKNWVQNQETIDATLFNDIQFLGNGCHGLVMKCSIPWLFENRRENFIVALKMVINLFENPTEEHAIGNENEFNILSNSSLQLHPNIVHMLGKFTSPPTTEMLNHVHSSIRDLCYRKSKKLKGAQFFLVECYPKKLQDVIEKENPSKNRKLKYVKQISRALLHLYESRIAHLDLKLDNIMVNDLDEIVLVDFGCAAKLDIDFNTAPGHLSGNREHLAPEILNKTQSVDILPCKGQFSWELGVLLFEIFSGGDLPWDTDPSSILHPNEKVLDAELNLIPFEFHSLLKDLLCQQDSRMGIIDAWKNIECIEFL